jgi:transposase-like protein
MTRRTIRDLTNAERREAARAYVAGSTMKEVARRFRVGVASIRNLLLKQNVHIRSRDEAQPPDYVPTPEEIEVGKEEIRKGWVDDDCNRNSGPRQTHVPRVCRLLGTERRLHGVDAKGTN